MTPYDCNFCGSIHIGHTPRNQRPKRKKHQKKTEYRMSKETEKKYLAFCKRHSIKA